MYCTRQYPEFWDDNEETAVTLQLLHASIKGTRNKDYENMISIDSNKMRLTPQFFFF